MEEKEVKDYIKKRYSKIVTQKEDSCCGENADNTCSCGIEENPIEQAASIGYSENELKSIPESAVLGVGCGNPTALAELKDGETVLDLGSGAGIDVFLAANKVGETGKVIGIDMTEEMIKKSRELAEKNNYNNVEFKHGEIENLPIEDNSVDVIISNCVINLSPNKSKVFSEAYRVLKDGGRLMVSDIVTEETLPDSVMKDFEAWAACIGGALIKNQYLKEIKNAGFKEIEIISEVNYLEEDLSEELKGKIKSIKIKAFKKEE